MKKVDSGTVVVIYGSGGHREQMKRILKGIKEKNQDLNFISVCDTKVKKPLTKQYFKNFEIANDNTLLMKLPLAFALAVIHVYKIKKRGAKIQGVFCTGPGIGIIYLLLFKLLGIKTIFLESWSRFYTKSFTGKIVYRFVDEFIVQNKECLVSYPRATYLGCRL